MKKEEIQNSVDRSKEWLDNFKKKLNADMPVVDKYKGKVVHKQTTFKFTVDEDEYLIICPPRKTGHNLFVVYKEGIKIYSHNPQGGHVNKTTAEYVLRLAINYSCH